MLLLDVCEVWFDLRFRTTTSVIVPISLSICCCFCILMIDFRVNLFVSFGYRFFFSFLRSFQPSPYPPPPPKLLGALTSGRHTFSLSHRASGQSVLALTLDRVNLLFPFRPSPSHQYLPVLDFFNRKYTCFSIFGDAYLIPSTLSFPFGLDPPPLSLFR